MADLALAANGLEPSIEDRLAINGLLAEYFDRADHGEACPSELFTLDGELTLGAMHASGRDAIASFFAGRAAQNQASGRKVRHFPSPPHVWMQSDDLASARSSIAVYAGVGEFPLVSALPSILFDFDDVIVREADAWRFRSRTARILFSSEAAADFTRSKPS